MLTEAADSTVPPWSTMILEVYYRHMPIYGKQAAEEEFPL